MVSNCSMSTTAGNSVAVTAKVSVSDGFPGGVTTETGLELARLLEADGHLDAHENHLISKVAGLLHVTHGEYIAAKLHARQSMRPADDKREG